MKKFILCLLLAVISPFSFAQEATGKIEKIQVCGTGNNSGPRWVRALMVQVDGKWFATYAEYYGYALEQDNDLSSSMLFMAFSQNLSVHIRGTTQWPAEGLCGVTSGSMFHSNKNDVIQIIR